MGADSHTQADALLSKLGLLPLHALAGSPMVLLADQEVVVGRDPGESGVKIADPRCSRKHAVFRAKEGVWMVEDLKSKNGTYVNGERIATTDLHAGDHVRIGHAEFAYGPEGQSYRCSSCMQTLVTAPAEAPFCTECRHTFPLLGATLGSRRLLRGLGTGSFGSVYVGHRRGNPYVALKVLHVEFTEAPDMVMKFLREAYATAGIEHENIVRFGDCGHEGGHWFIILEYFPSVSLREILEERGQVPEDEVLPMAAQILSAMEYAHARKLLHRDIKPGNILLSTEGKVKLVDFGLARRLVDSAFTQHTTSSMPGTPLFMAPELVTSNGRANFRTDIYSLGATLYRALTGRHPIEAKKLSDWLRAVQTQEAEPLKRHCASVSPRVEEAVTRALLKDPMKRFGSMKEFRSALGL